MESPYANLVAQVTKAIYADDTDQSEKLADVYILADEAQKDALDRAFICLCGWSLKTLMDRCEQEGVQDTMSPEWWSRP